MTGTATIAAAATNVLTPFTMLLGSKVVAPDGQAVGTVADVMMAAGDGRIVYVALSVGGIVGIGERMFAVPWRCFVVDPLACTLAVNFGLDHLDGLAGFDKDAWPTAPDEDLLAL